MYPCIYPSCTGLSPPTVAFSKYVPLSYIQLLGSSVFARHYSRNNYCSLFLRLLRCFSSPGFLPPHGGLQVFNLQGCPIRTSMDQRSFATPHSFSQLTTSFVVSESQGIHHTPLFASYSYLFSVINTRIFTTLFTYLYLSRVSTLSFSPNLSKNFYPNHILFPTRPAGYPKYTFKHFFLSLTPAFANAIF